MDKTYFLLKKNNKLQNVVPIVSPYVFSTINKEEAIQEKERLELHFLRNCPIDTYFLHNDSVSHKEIIDFDKYLIENYDFSFLQEGFDHSQIELNGQMLGGMFPSNLSDEELIKIQRRMDKYHFEFIEQVSNGKFIILLNPNDLRNPLRDSEIFQLTNHFETISEAKVFMKNTIADSFFTGGGTYGILGFVKENEITEITKKLLASQTEIRYRPANEDYGMQFVSDNFLSDNGVELLMSILKSIGRTPYRIVELKS